MSFRPGLANLASVIADTGREAILVALADGQALPAGELAEIAGVSPQSASRHLQKMVEGQLLEVWAQGRFRYYRLASEEIAALLETMSAIADRVETNKIKCARSSKQPKSLREARRAIITWPDVWESNWFRHSYAAAMCPPAQTVAK
jgi:DNA-binding transcriptional ArsR family regulator